MVHKKLNKKGNKKQQIIDLTNEYATQNLGMHQRNLKQSIRKMTGEIMKNKENIMDLVSKII